MEIAKENKHFIFKAFVIFVFLLILGVGSAGGHKGNKGEDRNIISVSGYGEVQAVPDIASVSFTISQDAKTVKEAQTLVADIEKKALDFLRETNVDSKDIQTSNASFYPKYEYTTTRLSPCNEFGCPPQQGKNVIVGYTASETVTVKIRNTDDVGKIIEGLGSVGVSNLNGPNFTIDKEDELKAEARKKAIEDAKSKARVLAKDLGVKLGKISSFNESEGGYYPMPMYSVAKEQSYDASASAPAEIPKGENTIGSNVVITYEIR